MLRVECLSKHFGTLTALNRVTFEVPRQAIAGVIGPNGAGKTTLLLGLAGLLPMDSGSLHWDNQVVPVRSRSRTIFYVEDAIRPHAQLKTEFVLRFYSSVFGRQKTFCEKIIERLKLREFLRARVSDLSKGTAKRLLVALGLLSTQPVLMLDEPFDGLDLKQMLEVVPLLREISAGGRTLMLSIHQLRDAERACDRLVLLNSGKVVGNGTLAELQSIAGCAPGAGLEEIFLALV